jgi:SAM-dependent methyltransferase
MSSSGFDSTARFSNRVDDYVRYRPGYPVALLDVLGRHLPPAGGVVADLGAGTGISSEFLLRSGAVVHAVEPNAAMRAAAQHRLGAHPAFRSVNGAAEATTLADASIDLVTAGQAFHWFDPASTRRECLRILRTSGAVGLFWNQRRVDATPFMRDFEAVVVAHGTDYREVSARYAMGDRLEQLFGGPFATHVFANEQVLDYPGLEGRLLSSSYVPGRGQPGHEPMLASLRQVFDDHAESGVVRIVYDTELYVGRLLA